MRSRPTARRDRANDGAGLRDSGQLDERDLQVGPGSQDVANCHGQPCLPDPARTSQRHEVHLGLSEQADHIVDGFPSPDQRRDTRRHGSGAAGRSGPCRAWPGLRLLRIRAVCRRRTSRREPLAEEDSQVVPHQATQLRGRTEGAIGVRAFVLDPIEHGGKSGLTVRGRHLHVHQARQVPRQLELVLQARDRHARPDPPVALPVEADEHVALGDVGAVQVPRRMRSRPSAEQHRRKAKRGDRSGRRRALFGQLTHCGADEHPQTLVRGADGRIGLLPQRHGDLSTGVTT